MYYWEIREFDLKLSGNYQGVSFHELTGNPELAGNPDFILISFAFLKINFVLFRSFLLL